MKMIQIENFINYYKPLFEKIIKSKLDEISKILINLINIFIALKYILF